MPKALVTGGARRLGKALAENFILKGWDTAITFNSSASGVDKLREFALANNCDVHYEKANFHNPIEIESAFDKIFKNFGLPDVLVNSAGLFMNRKSFLELNLNDWDSMNNINLRAVFLCSQIFAKYAANNSKIINISSLGGKEIWNGRLPYISSKHGVITLTEAMAKELAPKISVNCVAPGMIVIPNENADYENPVKIESIPMKRYGSPDDIFEAVYFFATCSSYITGQTLFVDGGLGL